MITLINGRPGVRAPLTIETRSPSADEIGNQESQLANPAAPVLDFIASDESIDRFDEVICAAGWRLDTYRRNPVFQNAHQYGDILFTLGKALITEVRTSPCPSDGREARGEGTPPCALPIPHLFQRVQFATDVNPVARVAYGLYKGKFLNAVSVGFIPLRWEDGPKASAAGKSVRNFRRKYLEQELLEVSAVGIPANPNALALGLKAGAIEKADLREILELLKCLGVGRPSRPLGLETSMGAHLPSRPPGVTASATLPGADLSQLLLFARQLHGILRHA